MSAAGAGCGAKLLHRNIADPLHKTVIARVL